MIDLLYPLGSGSMCSDQELRYSLRSVDRYLLNLGRVVVVGERPEWLRNVDYLDVLDVRGSPYASVGRKLRSAIEAGMVGDRFALMNDDFFLLAPVAEILPAHRGPLAQTAKPGRKRVSRYQSLCIATAIWLSGQGIAQPLDYGLHQPMMVETAAALEVLRRMPENLLFRSAYGNLHSIGGQQQLDVKRFWRWEGDPTGVYLSTCPRVVLTHGFRCWARSAYHTPSRFEAA